MSMSTRAWVITTGIVFPASRMADSHEIVQQEATSSRIQRCQPQAPTPLTNEQSIESLGRERSVGALATLSYTIALSYAIALPIPPHHCGFAGTTRSELFTPEESGWKEVYGRASRAVRVSGDSSDMFPPLKAVVDALSVLVKNFGVGTPPVSRSV